MTDLITRQEVPAYLATSDAPKGTEDLAKIIVPSRLYIMQPLTQDEELTTYFNNGDVVTVPEKELIYPLDGEPVPFTPIVFYREWCVWNPLKMQGQLPFIRERSDDPDGEIARRARDPSLRKAPCPENPDEDIRYMAHLNYLVMLRDSATRAFPVLMSFASSGFKTGQRFANLVVARGAALYGGVYTFKTSVRSNDQGKWWGFDISNAPEPWVPEDEFKLYAKLHSDLIDKVEEGRIQADYELPANEKGDNKYTEFADDEV